MSAEGNATSPQEFEWVQSTGYGKKHGETAVGNLVEIDNTELIFSD